MKVRLWPKLKCDYRKNYKFQMRSLPSGSLLSFHCSVLSTFRTLTLCPVVFREETFMGLGSSILAWSILTMLRKDRQLTREDIKGLLSIGNHVKSAFEMVSAGLYISCGM